MDFAEWEPTYRAICADMGYDPVADDASARLLASITLMSDLADGDAVAELMRGSATVFGAGPCLRRDLSSAEPEGTLICAGSACSVLEELGILPDILVTDLDGDIGPQLDFSRRGTLTLVHAHGGNAGLVQRHAPEFRGRIVLTTQGEPFGNVFDFGGFTDGDRAVCLARHFGAKRILLPGFDFDRPSPKEGSSPEVKARKLAWARRIILDGSGDAVFPQRL